MSYPDLAFRHAVAGMHLGAMFPKPMTGEFGAVLSVGTHPGVVEDNIRHRHLPISYANPDLDTCWAAADWAEDQLVADRTVLIRSEGGKQRPGIVVALVVISLGGTYYDALNCVRGANLDALTDFRFIDVLKAANAARTTTGAPYYQARAIR